MACGGGGLGCLGLTGTVLRGLAGVFAVALVIGAGACSSGTERDVRSGSWVSSGDVLRTCALRVCREFPWVADGAEMGDLDRLHVERTGAFRTFGLRSREARGVMAKGAFRRLVFFVPGDRGACLYVADRIDGGLISCEANADAVGRGLVIEFLEPPPERHGSPVRWVIRADPRARRPVAKIKAAAAGRVG